MGIVNPRPAMRKREARDTEARLRRHAELMAHYESRGYSRLTASSLAYKKMLDDEKRPLPPIQEG